MNSRETQEHDERKHSIEAANANRQQILEEHRYLGEAVKDKQFRLRGIRTAHDRSEVDIRKELYGLRRSLEMSHAILTEPPVTESTLLDLEADIAREESIADKKVAKAKQECRLQKEELQWQEEAVSLWQAAAEDREEAASKVARFNSQQQLLLMAQREREAAARDLQKAHVQIEHWIYEHAALKQREAAEWNRLQPLQ